MNLAKRLLMVAGAVALAGTFGVIVTPKAAHAVIATFVQVVNTSANPVSTTDVSKSASQIVELTCDFQPPPGFFTDSCGQVDPNSGIAIGIFTVPANQRLVITTIDVRPLIPEVGPLEVGLLQENPVTFSSITRELFTLPGGPMTQFQYSASGIVIGPGAQLSQSGSSVADFRIRGYLTPN